MPVQLPMPPAVPALDEYRPTGAGYAPQVVLQQEPQQEVRIPQVEIAIEVVGNLPLQAKLEDLTRRLGRRQTTRSINRSYPPTILELITLVTRNPEKPRDRSWIGIPALNMKFEPRTGLVTVEYCVEHCGHNPRSGAFDPTRRMVSYSAPEAQVVSKVNKKMAGLKKFADNAPGREPQHPAPEMPLLDDQQTVVRRMQELDARVGEKRVIFDRDSQLRATPFRDRRVGKVLE